MENEKRCDEWQDDLQQQRADSEASGTLLKGTASLSLFLPMKNQIQSNVENVQRQFNGLREFLDSKENGELHRLKEDKEEVVKRLEESENELVQQRQWVRDLISDVEHQLELSTMEMLQNVNNVLRRSQTLRLKQPQMIPNKTFQAPDLNSMLQSFPELMMSSDSGCNNNSSFSILPKKQLFHL
ncbi:mCG14411, isoform CRA_a [Mus musculus]|nr:mCG14411, isoform CRA_a [Mus musculus]